VGSQGHKGPIETPHHNRLRAFLHMGRTVAIHTGQMVTLHRGQSVVLAHNSSGALHRTNSSMGDRLDRTVEGLAVPARRQMFAKGDSSPTK
jgi:hypothetical protein